MIPKIIHYCWLSNDPVPENLQKYMSTWRQHLPDYEFIKWDFNRFPKESSKWVSEAFDNKKYAFAADYIRLYALYNYGGIYLDMDVEILKSFDEFLELDEMLCYEKDGNGAIEMAVIGFKKNSEFIKQCLKYYENRSFIKEDNTFDTTTIPYIVTKILLDNYKVLDTKFISKAIEATQDGFIPVFPSDFFSPKSYNNGKIYLSNNTVAIHHFAGSWLSKKERIIKFLTRIFGKKIITFLHVIKNIQNNQIK